MANGNNGHSTSAAPSASHHIYSYPAPELESVLRMIREQRLTGSLTIHFSNGTPSSQVEWKERLASKSGPIASLIRERPNK